jgi:hypothetical protein
MDSSSETKTCPYCGEAILAVARKCRHCRSYLDPSARPAAPPPDALERALLPVGRPLSAIAAGYLGLFSLFPVIGVVAGIAAVWTGIVALRRLKENPELSGKGRAIFGIVMGILFGGFQLLILFFVLLAALLSK